MMRSSLSYRPSLPLPSSCSCRRQASHFPASLSSAAAPPPPPLPSVYASSVTPEASASTSNTLSENPTWSDPSYLARYRDPTRHDVFSPSGRPTASHKRAFEFSSNSKPSNSTAPTDNGSNGNRNGNGKGKRSRRNRLEMEALWSGGDFSPPIPLESYHAQTFKPQHALLFPGSGSQYVGMGHFLREKGKGKEVWREAEDALAGFEEWRKGLKLDQLPGELGELGRMLDAVEAKRRTEASLQQVVFEGPQDELTRSANAQPAILITSLAFLRTLESQLSSSIVGSSSLILGHSSGEYSAAVAAGALSLADGVRLTRLHGLLTHHALSLPSIGLSPDPDAPARLKGQMSALVLNPGHSHAELTAVIRKIRAGRPNQSGSEGTVEVASFNSSTQVVLAGSRDGILRASEVLKELEIASRAADLPVSAPFHCSFMLPAAMGIEHALTTGVRLSTPSVPLVSGLDASLIASPSSLVSNLVSQISLPVRWSTCINSLPDTHGIRRLVFLGPGQALANLARRDHKLLKEARAALRGEDGEGVKEMETEVVSVATEKDMDRLVEMWEDEAADGEEHA
ncbi:hypothetical protein JCM21900_002240 [Sporobolomyces salmonicolor]